MKMTVRNRRLSTALLAAGSLFAIVQPALGQEANADGASADSGDIVVTARRREESLVDVPIAITAVSGDQLAQLGATDITALADMAPNVTLEPSRGTNSTLSAFIRGVGQQDPVSGFEQGVGIYLDDVYLNRPQAAVLDIYDVQRIEVLRGPQGTLYGRNTVGGAVKYVTRRLDDVAHLSARATYGSFDQADGVVTASTPVGAGVLRLGGSLARLSRGGFGKNLTTGEENYNKDIWAGRLSAEVHGTGIFARLSGDYTRDKSNARGGHRLLPSVLSKTPVLANVFDTQGGLVSPKQDVKAWGTSLFVEGAPTDWLTLRSITALRKDESTSPIDFDALPAVDVDVPAFYKNRQISQELQALVNVGKLNGLVGMYYLNASALTQFDVRLFTTVNGLTAYTTADVNTDTIAAFADFTYDFTDQLSLSVGGRYTWDERKARILRQNYVGGGSPVFGGAGIAAGGPSTNFRGKATFSKFTPRASLAFKPDGDTTFYASFSQGFKGGGFDPRGVGTSAPDLNGDGIRSDAEVADYLSFLPEKVNSYEIGAKANLMDRRVYVALAAFRMDYSDVQIPGSVGCISNGLPTFCGVVSNAGKARMQGFELETRAKLTDDGNGGGLSFNGSVGYIDAKFLRYIGNMPGYKNGATIGTPTDFASVRKVQNTPAWTGNASLNYGLPLGSGRLDIGGGVTFKSKTYQFEVPNPYLDQKGYSLFDASLVYRGEGNRWSIGVFGKNLTNKRYKTSGYTFYPQDPRDNSFVLSVTPALTNGQPNPAFLVPGMAPALGKEGVLTAYYGNPRQIYVTATVSF